MSISPTSFSDVTVNTTTSLTPSCSANDDSMSPLLSTESDLSAFSDVIPSPISANSTISVPVSAAIPLHRYIPGRTDDQALSFYTSEKDRESAMRSIHGHVPNIFRSHCLEMIISGKHWGESLNPVDSLYSLSARVAVHFPDSTVHTLHTDVVTGFNDPEFLHRIQLPALSMVDSQGFVRNTSLEITACCDNIPFGIVRFRLVDLVWQLVVQRELRLLITPDLRRKEEPKSKVGRSFLRLASQPLALVRSASSSSSMANENEKQLRSLVSQGRGTGDQAVPLVTVKMIKGRRMEVLNGRNKSGHLKPIILNSFTLFPESMSLPVISSLSPSTPSSLSLATISDSPSTLRNIPMRPIMFPASSSFPSTVNGVPNAGDIEATTFPDKKVIFDISMSAHTAQPQHVLASHVTLSTACEKGGHWALVTTNETTAQSSSNLLSSSHMLFGSDHDRQCRLQAIVIANGRKYQLGFCQFRLAQLAERRFVQWHMRGGKGLTTLVEVSNFIHCPSFIHVTLFIGGSLQQHQHNSTEQQAVPQQQRSQIGSKHGRLSAWSASLKRRLQLSKIQSAHQLRETGGGKEKGGKVTGKSATVSSSGGGSISIYSVKFPDEGQS